MASYDLTLTDFERIFHKRYKLVIAIALAAMASTGFFLRLKPSLYRTSASVKVDRMMRAGVGTEFIPYGVWDNIEAQAKVVTSLPVVMRAAVKMRVIPSAILEKETIEDPRIMGRIAGLRSKIKVSIESQTNVLRVTITSHSPKEARDLANSVVQAYKEFALDEKKAEITKTRRFVEEQLRRSKRDLMLAENSLRAFEENMKLPVVKAEMSNAVSQVVTLEKDIEDLRERRMRILQQMSELKGRLRQPLARVKSQDSEGGFSHPEEADPDEQINWLSEFASGDQGLSSLNKRLIDYQLSMDDLLAYYRKDHPSVLDLELKIKKTLRKIIKHLEGMVQKAQDREQELLAKLGDVNDVLDKLPGEQMEYARLGREKAVAEELHTLLAKKLQESQIGEAGVVDDVSVISLAALPRRPINKKYPRMLISGFLLGMLLGVVAAILREMIDTSIGTVEDVEHYLNLPVLAVIPHMRMETQEAKLLKRFGTKDIPHLHDKARLITQFDPKNPAAEAYKILRTNLHFLSANRSTKTILVTSSTMQEGKSTTISNLAIAFAQNGTRVLLVGCNLRRPSLYRVFGVDKGPGMADVLVNRVDWHDCIKTIGDFAVGEFDIEDVLATPGMENLNLITFGKIPPNPTELLSSNKMDSFLEEAKKEYDLILIDCPPLLPVADSSLLSMKVDGTLVVYQVGKAPRNSLRRGKERLESVKAPILGLVLNDIRPEISGASYVSQYYLHYYGEPTDRHRKAMQGKRPSSQQRPPSSPGASAAVPAVAAAVGAKLLAQGPSLLESTWALLRNRVFQILLAAGIVASAGLGGSQKERIPAFLKRIRIRNPIHVEDTRAKPESKLATRKKAPTPKPAGYTVQLGGWSSEQKARRRLREFSSRGIATFMEKHPKAGRKEMFRLCSGKFDSKTRAQTHSRLVKAAGPEAEIQVVLWQKPVPVPAPPGRELPIAVSGLDGEEPKPVAQKRPSEVVKQRPKKKKTYLRTDYCVQLYSFRSEGPALRKMMKLRKKGVPSFVEQARVQGKGLFFRVCAGPYGDPQEARDMAYHLAQQGRPKPILRKRRSTVQMDEEPRAHRPTLKGKAAKYPREASVESWKDGRDPLQTRVFLPGSERSYKPRQG